MIKINIFQFKLVAIQHKSQELKKVTWQIFIICELIYQITLSKQENREGTDNGV